MRSTGSLIGQASARREMSLGESPGIEGGDKDDGMKIIGVRGEGGGAQPYFKTNK